MVKKLSVILMILVMSLALAAPALAADAADEETAAAAEESAETGKSSVTTKAISAAITIGLVATAGAIAMGSASCKAVEGIARQPESESKIRTTLMLGLVFIETAIIYALLAVILIIFVL